MLPRASRDSVISSRRSSNASLAQDFPASVLFGSNGAQSAIPFPLAPLGASQLAMCSGPPPGGGRRKSIPERSWFMSMNHWSNGIPEVANARATSPIDPPPSAYTTSSVLPSGFLWT